MRTAKQGNPSWIINQATIPSSGLDKKLLDWMRSVNGSDVDIIKADQNGDIPGVIRSASNPVLFGTDKKLRKGSVL
jgi:hypothetical protein